MESILDSIKKLLGISSEYTQFDDDIIMHINSTFLTLNQLGVGPSGGFFIFDNSDVWSDFIGTDVNYNAVKTYVYLKVKLLFDPPLSSAVIESINRMISELEWRLLVLAETATFDIPQTNNPVYKTMYSAVLGSARLGTMKLGYTAGG